MKTIKIIDLYIKIANGEEVPEKIKYRNKIFMYGKDCQCYIEENYNKYNDLLMELSNHKGTDFNYEVEIIEDTPKKIELDHFKSIEELKEQVDKWIENDEMYWTRWFGLYDLKKLIDMIKGE